MLNFEFSRATFGAYRLLLLMLMVYFIHEKVVVSGEDGYVQIRCLLQLYSAYILS